MKDPEYPALELEIPVGLMPLLLSRMELPLPEIQKILGVSEQAFHEFCNGRGRLSPMKAGRIAGLARLSARELSWIAEAARNWRPEVKPKEGATLTHPFRGEAKVRRLDHATVDLVLVPKDRPMNGVPLLVFERDFIAQALLRLQDHPEYSVADEGGEAATDGAAGKPVTKTKIDIVPVAEVSAFIEASGLSHASLASLLGISPSVITAHAEGSYAMPRSRFERLQDAVAKITRKKESVVMKSAPPKMPKSPENAPKPLPETPEKTVDREKVSNLIKASGLANRQIAALLGISASMVGHYMTGRNKMSAARFATLQDMLKNRHVHQEAPADHRAAKTREPVLAAHAAPAQDADILAAEAPATAFVTGISVIPQAPALPLAAEPPEGPQVPVRQAEPPAKTPAVALLKMLDIVQASLAELFGGKEALARRMALLDILPEGRAAQVIDGSLLQEIRGAQAAMDQRISGVESQVKEIRGEISGIALSLQRIEHALAERPKASPCSVSRLAKLLAAD